jgi:hypothetical protein
VGGGGADRATARYGFREALHAARDRFTPRFAHRHTEAELVAWFTSQGFGSIRTGGARDLPDWLPVAWRVCSSADGSRPATANETPPSQSS